MNFSPFGVPFTTGSLPVGQFTTNGKFPQNISGQVVGVLQGGEGGVHYLRPVEGASEIQTDQHNGNGQSQQTATAQMNLISPTLITLPITMPGAKPGDPQQTVQIQVIAGQPTQPKYQVAQLPIQAFQQPGNGSAVLTVAYNGDQQNGVLLADGSQGLPEGVTVVAALQPHDLQLLQAGATLQTHQPPDNGETGAGNDEDDDKNNVDGRKDPQPVALVKTENVKTEVIQDGDHLVTSDYYLQRMQSNSLINQYLKFTAETIKRESQYEYNPQTSTGENAMGDETRLVVSMEGEGEDPNAENGDKKKKKRYKKKPPKPKKPKPGQVHIATALDGTTLFCCPECHMAYPEKESLEQHLIGHKIERRFICDICGAGLKRKEHLERHKLGHNPERPFVCSVCLKGFKRKEHLNLHYVIHSGEKTEICGECGKGFYRKDHLRKHARSHAARRLKEEMQQAQAKAAMIGHPMDSPQPQTQQHHLTIQVSNEAIEAMGLNPNNVPTTQIQVPVQIQVPPHHLVGDDSNSNNVPTTTQIQVPVQIEVPQHHLQIRNGAPGDPETTSDENSEQVSTVVLPAATETVVLPTVTTETGTMTLIHQTQPNSQQH